MALLMGAPRRLEWRMGARHVGLEELEEDHMQVTLTPTLTLTRTEPEPEPEP